MQNLPSIEERVWAVLSHLSAIAFGMGIVLPVIGWSEQRRKSNYASFQCMQALGYQSLGYTVWILFSLVIAIVFMIFMVAGLSGTDNINMAMGVWLSGLFVVMFALLGIYLLVPVIAAIACALGKDFRYPIMGRCLAKYLGYDTTQAGDDQIWLNEDHEDRWVTAMGHFSIIIVLWGMLAPLTAWILQGKRSLFVKFQSIQTLVYQAGVMILFVGAGFMYMVGFGVLGAMVGLDVKANPIASPNIAALIIFGILMLIAFVVILIVPLFHVLGQWAGYRVLKGDDYRYPILGKVVEKQLRSTSGSQTPYGA